MSIAMNTQLLRRTQHEISSNQIVNLEDDKFSIEWWVLVAAGLNPNQIADTYSAARKLLRISQRRADQLFIGYNWPLSFCRRFRNETCSARLARRNARIAAERIDHFIRTGR